MSSENTSFYDRFWAGRPDTVNEDERARMTEIHRLIGRVTPVSGPILDVGCGTGWLTSTLAAYGEVRGVDTSPGAVRRARRSFPSLRFDLVGEGSPLGRGDHALVVCSEVIEHVEDQPGFAARLAGALAPAGHLVLTTPNLKARPEWEALEPRLQPREDWLSPRQLDRLMRSAGLIPLESRIFFTKFTTRGVYRLVNSERFSRWSGRIGFPGLPVSLAEKAGWGLYQSLLARKTR